MAHIQANFKTGFPSILIPHVQISSAPIVCNLQLNLSFCGAQYMPKMKAIRAVTWELCAHKSKPLASPRDSPQRDL